MTYDDAYSPPKTAEQTRKLVESDVVSGVTKFANFAEFPMTTTGLPSYNTEGRIYAKYITQTLPYAGIAILCQNDDLGKDFVAAFKEALKDDFEKKVVVSPYEVTEPTIDSRVKSLKSSEAQAFLVAGTLKFAAQAIKKANEIGWAPLFLIKYVSSSVSATIMPAGTDKAVGIVAATVTKDPNDKRWADDPGMKWYRAHFDISPAPTLATTTICSERSKARSWNRCPSSVATIFSRENILKQACNIRGLCFRSRASQSTPTPTTAWPIRSFSFNAGRQAPWNSSAAC